MLSTPGRRFYTLAEPFEQFLNDCSYVVSYLYVFLGYIKL